MKTIKPDTEPEQEIPCFECETGTLVPTVRDHAVEIQGGKKLTIPDVPMLVCNECGDTVTGDEGNAIINAFLDKTLNAKNSR